MNLNNADMANYDFLAEMYADAYFPDRVVDRVRHVLVKLCEQIEAEPPQGDAAVLELTHAATEAINDLEEAFYEAGSEIETAARDCIGGDFSAILDAYGFEHIDIEEAIAPREW